MKKTILLSLAAMLLVGSAFAQDATSKIGDSFKKYRFGLFVGPTFNSLKPTVDAVSDNKGDYKVEATSGRTSFSVGLNAELAFSSKYSLYSGIGLDWNGGTINTTHDTASTLDPEYVSSADVTYRNQYLAIPLGLKMYAFEAADFKIFVQTGIDVSLLLSQKGDWDLRGGMVTDSVGENEKLNDVAKVVPVNIGWHIGAGAEYGLSNGSAVYGAIMYRNGFTDYTTPQLNDKGNRFVDGNIRSNTIALRIGYFF